jgi:hypothetical protein
MNPITIERIIMETVAVLLTKETMCFAMSRMITVKDRAAFAFACLTSAYNGEHWYYVGGNLSMPFPVDYAKQIMTEAKLKETFDINGDIRSESWFTVVQK